MGPDSLVRVVERGNHLSGSLNPPLRGVFETFARSRDDVWSGAETNFRPEQISDCCRVGRKALTELLKTTRVETIMNAAQEIRAIPVLVFQKKHNLKDFQVIHITAHNGHTTVCAEVFFVQIFLCSSSV